MTELKMIQKQIDQLSEHLETLPLLEKRKRTKAIEKLIEKQKAIYRQEMAKRQGQLFGNY